LELPMMLQTGLKVLLMTFKTGLMEQLMMSQVGQLMPAKTFVIGLLMQLTISENSHQIYSTEWEMLQMM